MKQLTVNSYLSAMSVNALNQQNMQFDMNCKAFFNWQDPSQVPRIQFKLTINLELARLATVVSTLQDSIRLTENYWYLLQGWTILIWIYQQSFSIGWAQLRLPIQSQNISESIKIWAINYGFQVKVSPWNQTELSIFKWNFLQVIHFRYSIYDGK